MKAKLHFTRIMQNKCSFNVLILIRENQMDIKCRSIFVREINIVILYVSES